MPAGRPSEKKEIHICQGKRPCRTISDALLRRCYPESFECTAKASILENNKWYCKRHAPSAVAERERKSEETYMRRIYKNMENNG